jgi:outer membrane lipoprotein LolB
MASKFNLRLIFWSASSLILVSCSLISVPPDSALSNSSRNHLYQLSDWFFDGRLAVSGRDDSWSASLSWKHSINEDELKLSGPLGQGATLIHLSNDFVTIDRGAGQVESSSEPEDFMKQQVGISVPLQSLRFWVIGLPQPEQKVVKTIDGFIQDGWLVSYNQMQAVFGQQMPRKISVVNSNLKVKLKLVIDRWVLNNEK